MEIKIVVNIKETKAVIGVQSPGCDPVFETAEGDLAEILGHTANLVETATERWKTQPKNPAIKLPEPKKEAVTASSKSGSPAKAKAVPSPQTQPPMFG